MKIAILNDRSVLNHPFARLLVKSLTQDGHDVTLASTDFINGHAFYDFSKSAQILNAFGDLRVPKYGLMSKKLGTQFYLRFCTEKIKDFDKLFTRFRARQLVPLTVYLLSVFNAFNLKVDVLIVSRPQTILAQLVLIALRKLRIRKMTFIYYPYELYGQQINAGKRIIIFLEKYFVKNIYDAIVVPSDGRLTYYKAMNPTIMGIVVRNFKKYHPYENSSLRESAGLNLVYLGLIDYGRKIEEIIDNLELLPSGAKLFLVGKVRKQWSIDNQVGLNRWISKGRLELVAEIPENLISSQLSKYDVGLISYQDSCLNNRLCAPAKVTDYLHAGLPIIAPDLPGIVEIAKLSSNIVIYDRSDIRELFRILVEISSNLTARKPWEVSESSANLNWDNEYRKFRALLVSLRDEWALSGSNRRPTD